MLFLLIALIASGSTIVVGRMWLQGQKPAPELAAKAQEATAPMVLVAKGNIPAGSFLRPDNLKWERWPATGIAPLLARLIEPHPTAPLLQAAITTLRPDDPPTLIHDPLPDTNT